MRGTSSDARPLVAPSMRRSRRRSSGGLEGGSTAPTPPAAASGIEELRAEEEPSKAVDAALQPGAAVPMAALAHGHLAFPAVVATAVGGAEWHSLPDGAPHTEHLPEGQGLLRQMSSSLHLCMASAAQLRAAGYFYEAGWASLVQGLGFYQEPRCAGDLQSVW